MFNSSHEVHTCECERLHAYSSSACRHLFWMSYELRLLYTLPYFTGGFLPSCNKVSYRQRHMVKLFPTPNLSSQKIFTPRENNMFLRQAVISEPVNSQCDVKCLNCCAINVLSVFCKLTTTKKQLKGYISLFDMYFYVITIQKWSN